MKCHSLIPLVAAGILLGALPAAADHRPAVTLTARFGLPLPPAAIVIVREPVRREVLVVERSGKDRHHYRDARRQEPCGERGRKWKRAHYDDRQDRHSDRRDYRGDRVVVVNRGWGRFGD